MIDASAVEQGKDGQWYAVAPDDDAWNGPFETEKEAMNYAYGVSDEDAASQE